MGVVWLMHCGQVVWVEQCALEQPRFINIAVSRMFHVPEIDSVLLVLNKVEVPRENSGLFDVVGDACRELFDGADSFFVLVAS